MPLFADTPGGDTPGGDDSPGGDNSSDALPVYRLDSDGLAGFLKSRPSGWCHWVEDNAFTAAPGQSLLMAGDDGRIAALLQGRRPPEKGGAFADGAHAGRLPPLVWVLADTDDEEDFGLGFLLGQYRFDRFRTGEGASAARPLPQILIRDETRRHRVQAIADGVCFGRDLINTPANHLNPQGMEDESRKLARAFGGRIKVIKGAPLAGKFPAIEAVGRAAESPPRLIDMRWGDAGPLITLIGKGVTFDSGGLDLKPSAAMEMMKKDMGGAAIALGLARVVMTLGLPLRLRVLIPVAENAVSARAMRPLDVIATAAGIPVEVGNTDAEGRLILADALHCATSGKDKPDMVLDFATLTGAARVALGTELPALFSNDDRLLADFIAAGEEAGDPLWGMPLHAPYDRFLESGHAALSSTGTARYGGAITAALFLKRFVAADVPWAHMDVMAWNLAARPGHPKGGETMGLRAALRLIEGRLEK